MLSRYAHIRSLQCAKITCIFTERFLRNRSFCRGMFFLAAPCIYIYVRRPTYLRIYIYIHMHTRIYNTHRYVCVCIYIYIYKPTLRMYTHAYACVHHYTYGRSERVKAVLKKQPLDSSLSVNLDYLSIMV